MSDPRAENMVEAALELLIQYQAWSSEKVVALHRATSVVYNLMDMLAESTSQKAMTKALVQADWCSMASQAKPLVKAVWPLRKQVIEDRNTVRFTL